jgi:hypothetical protein
MTVNENAQLSKSPGDSAEELKAHADRISAAGGDPYRDKEGASNVQAMVAGPFAAMAKTLESIDRKTQPPNPTTPPALGFKLP